MKALLVINNLNQKDGWSRYSFDLVSGLKSRGIEVVTVAEKKCSVSDYSIFSDSSTYTFKILKVITDSFKLRKIISKEKPDIIHFCVEPFANFLPFLNVKNKSKVLLTLHGSYSYFPNMFLKRTKRLISSLLYNSSIKKIDRFISVSNFTKNYFAKNTKHKYDNSVSVINNGVDLSNFSFFNREKQDNNKKTILFIGEVKRRKGLLESIEALKVYRDKYANNFNYEIIGKYNSDSDYYKLLKNKVAEYNMEQNITFHGRLDDATLKKYLSQADLFLMLPIMDNYRFEGFGLVYLEANAYGVPCIGSINSGAEEAIKNGVSGFLTDPSNSADVAEKISFVLDGHLSKDKTSTWAKQNSIVAFVNNIANCYYSNLKL